jgi:hypothetical protein
MPQRNCQVLYAGPKEPAYSRQSCLKCIILNNCGQRQFTYEEVSVQLRLHVQYVTEYYSLRQNEGVRELQQPLPHIVSIL